MKTLFCLALLFTTTGANAALYINAGERRLDTVVEATSYGRYGTNLHLTTAAGRTLHFSDLALGQGITYSTYFLESTREILDLSKCEDDSGYRHVATYRDSNGTGEMCEFKNVEVHYTCKLSAISKMPKTTPTGANFLENFLYEERSAWELGLVKTKPCGMLSNRVTDKIKEILRWKP